MVDKFIALDEKKRRLQILNDTVKEASKMSNLNSVGKTYEVLVEKIKTENGLRLAEGRSRNNKVVHFKSNTAQIGDFVDVEINEALVWCIKGEEVKADVLSGAR